MHVYVLIVHFALIQISFAKIAVDILFHLQRYCGHCYYNKYMYVFFIQHSV